MESIKLFLTGTDRLRDMLCSTADGGRKLSRGVRELVAEQYAGKAEVDVVFEPSVGAASLRQAIEDGSSQLSESAANLVVTSVDAEFAAGDMASADAYERDMLAVIRSIKANPGSHVIVLLASTIDPETIVSNYQREESDPTSLRVHRYDLAAMRLSFEEGISVLDVDRIIAEMGAADHVPAFLEYSEAACQAIATELVRIMDDYAFFDDRPLLPQVGREDA